jgi:hypothetical protein
MKLNFIDDTRKRIVGLTVYISASEYMKKDLEGDMPPFFEAQGAPGAPKGGEVRVKRGMGHFSVTYLTSRHESPVGYLLRRSLIVKLMLGLFSNKDKLRSPRKATFAG